METIPLDMDDLFGEEEDVQIPARLPDLEDLDLDGGLEPMQDPRYEDDEQQAAAEDEPITDNPELLNKLKSLKGASKTGQRRTMIKLDATRLTGERGIPALPKIFQKVKLKGKHHETEDLKTIMHHLEHWAHRLFPKMTFSDVLERTERLGAKKEVQTCVKRIRLDMPVLPSDMVGDEEDVHREGDGEDVQREGNDDGDNEDDSSVKRQQDSTSNQVPNEDEIDELLSMEQELSQGTSTSQSQAGSSQGASATKPKAATATTLSEDMRAKIERNKKLAMERRAARLAKESRVQGENSGPSELTTQSAPSNDQMDTSSSSIVSPSKTLAQPDTQSGDLSEMAVKLKEVSCDEISQPQDGEIGDRSDNWDHLDSSSRKSVGLSEESKSDAEEHNKKDPIAMEDDSHSTEAENNVDILKTTDNYKDLKIAESVQHSIADKNCDSQITDSVKDSKLEEQGENNLCLFQTDSAQDSNKKDIDSHNSMRCDQDIGVQNSQSLE